MYVKDRHTMSRSWPHFIYLTYILYVNFCLYAIKNFSSVILEKFKFDAENIQPQSCQLSYEKYYKMVVRKISNKSSDVKENKNQDKKDADGSNIRKGKQSSFISLQYISLYFLIQPCESLLELGNFFQFKIPWPLQRKVVLRNKHIPKKN